MSSWRRSLCLGYCYASPAALDGQHPTRAPILWSSSPATRPRPIHRSFAETVSGKWNSFATTAVFGSTAAEVTAHLPLPPVPRVRRRGPARRSSGRSSPRGRRRRTRPRPPVAEDGNGRNALDPVPVSEHGLHVDLTGWHEPESSHLLLLDAVATRTLRERSYRAALAHGYLWHEFGDLHLILP
jgi:Queuosine biosynthesis protein